VARGM
jgi:hypothetical protein